MTTEGLNRYRPWRLSRATATMLYQRHEAFVHDLYYDPAIASQFAAWDSFKTFDQFLLSYFSHGTIDEVAPLLQASPAARLSATIVRAAQARQLAVMRERAAFSRTEGVLQALTAQGVLISENTLLGLSAQQSSSSPSVPITTVGILTRNRPDALMRCVSSHLTAARSISRPLSVLVIDESDVERHQIANRTALETLASRYDTSITHIGQKERLSLVEDLCAKGIPADAARLAVLGSSHETITASLNLLLLLTAGRTLLVTDDGTTSRGYRHPDYNSTLIVTQETSRVDRTVRMTADWAEHEQGGVRLFDTHEAVLGRSVPDVIRAFRGSGAVSLQTLCEHLVEALISPSASVVLSSVRPLEPGQSVFCAPQEYFLSHCSGPLDRCFAIDNRTLLPPVLGTAGAPGAMLKEFILRFAAHRYFVDAPVAVCCSRPSDPIHSESAPVAAGYAPLEAIVLAFLTVAGPTTRIGETSCRLQRAGRALEAAAALDMRELNEWLGSAVGTVLRSSADISHRQTNARHAVLAAGDGLIAAETVQDADLAHARICTRRLLATIGRMWQYWHRMIEVSHTVCQEHRLGVIHDERRVFSSQ